MQSLVSKDAQEELLKNKTEGLEDPEVQEIINRKLKEIGIEPESLKATQPYVYKMICVCYLQNYA